MQFYSPPQVDLPSYEEALKLPSKDLALAVLGP